MDMEGKFLYHLIKRVKDSVKFTDMDTDSQDKWARKFITQCVDNELAYIKQSQCDNCSHGQHDNCLGFECPRGE